MNHYDNYLLVSLVPVAMLVVVAITAVVIARIALSNTESTHRAAILRALAAVVASFRSRR